MVRQLAVLHHIRIIASIAFTDSNNCIKRTSTRSSDKLDTGQRSYQKLICQSNVQSCSNTMFPNTNSNKRFPCLMPASSRQHCCSCGCGARRTGLHCGTHTGSCCTGDPAARQEVTPEISALLCSPAHLITAVQRAELHIASAPAAPAAVQGSY